MSTKVKCIVCGRELDNRGVRWHMTEKHPVQNSAQNTENPVLLEDSSKLKVEVATLQDSIKSKDEQVALLSDSIKTKDTEFATLHDEITKLSSTEHEQDVVRETLKGLTKEAYVTLGIGLGYLESPPQVADKGETALVQDSKKSRKCIEALRAVRDLIGDTDLPDNGELSGAAISDLVRATVSELDGKLSDSTPVAVKDKETAQAVAQGSKPESEISMGKRDEPGWKYYEALGFSVKEPTESK